MDDEIFGAWRERVRSRDKTATVVNLYELIARPRGLRPEQLPVQERIRLSNRALQAMVPGFEVAAESDRGVEPIVLVPYDPAWPARFTRWKDRLAAAITPPPRRIEHVGSTAVPGLTAKPVIDIQVSVDDIRNESTYVPPIESLGVQLRSRDDDHRYFRPFAGRPRDVHIHVCDAGSEWERRHPLFVAYLRADAAAREGYMEAKQSALARWADDRIAYTESKDEVIRNLMVRAESWARVVGWSF